MDRRGITRQRATTAIAALLGVVLAFDVFYLYAVKLARVVHSDTAANMLIAAASVDSRSLLTRQWYYSNGDVWLLTPHLFAMLPVAIAGVGTTTLIVSWVLGIAVELAGFVWSYRQLAKRLDVAIIAAGFTLIAWSRMHVMFVYVEISYGMLAVLYLALFAIASQIVTQPPEGARPKAPLVVGAILLFLVTAMNPVRALVCLLAPAALACAWPWKNAPIPLRGSMAAGATASWLAGYVLYESVFKRTLTFSNPTGHVDFVLRDASGIIENVRTIGRGFLMLAGSDGNLEVLALPMLCVLLGAAVLVVHYVVTSRVLTRTRFVAVAVLGQLGATLVPMSIGNLVLNAQSIRYALPAVMVLFGLAAIIAVGYLGEVGRHRKLSIGWLALSSVAAMTSALRVFGDYTFEAPNGQWAHRDAHHALADELSRRDLRHGYATYWNANLVTLLSRGRARTCPVNFAERVFPYRWGTNVLCFDATRLPDRIFVALTPADRALAYAAVEATLPPPTERFVVADYFDVLVFQTAEMSPNWLIPPIVDGERLKLPLRIASTHPQMRQRGAHEKGGTIVATGEEGAIIFGPYLEMPKGRYWVRFVGTAIESPGEIAFDVTARGGQTMLAQSSVLASALPRPPHSELARLEVSLPESMRDIELRVLSRGGGRVAVDELVVERP